MKTRKPTSAQIRDRQKTKDLKRIADALEDLVFIADKTVQAIGTAAATAYGMFVENTKRPPENVQ